MWMAVVLVALSADCTAVGNFKAGCCTQVVASANDDSHVHGTMHLAESKNFQVQSHARYDARAVARSCEQWREHLQTKWLGDEHSDSWTPRCLVVIHSRREAYQGAIGRGGDWSYGSSWVDTQDEGISQRRIDLLIDPQGTISAFAHELTHVVLADAFVNTQLSLWANEGIAILADSAEKQRLHQRDLHQSIQQQTCFHCAELTQLAGYPSANRIPAFYGQSASLVALLSQSGGSEKLVPFLKTAAVDGYDKALRDTYGIAGMADLQRRWNQGRTKIASAF
jgi:hypothetical protein